jgi:hypothetical protein
VGPEFGATHTSTPRPTDPVEAIQELTGGFGADVVIEAVGRPETYKQAFYARDLAGTVVLVGVPTPDMTLELPLLDVFGRGGALKSSWYGDCLPSRDFPMLIDLYLQGRLDLDAFVSERSRSTTSRRRSTKMHHGDVLRSVVLFSARARPAGRTATGRRSSGRSGAAAHAAAGDGRAHGTRRGLRPGDVAGHADHAADTVRPLLGERVSRLVRLHRDGWEDDPVMEDVQTLRQADEASWASGLDAGVLEDWRTVLELVAARHARPRTVG